MLIFNYKSTIERDYAIDSVQCIIRALSQCFKHSMNEFGFEFIDESEKEFSFAGEVGIQSALGQTCFLSDFADRCAVISFSDEAFQGSLDDSFFRI